MANTGNGRFIICIWVFNRLLRGQSRCKTTQQCSAFSQALTLCVLPFLFKKGSIAKSWTYLAYGGPFYSSSSSQYSSAYLASQLSPNIWERMFRWQIFCFSAENNKKNGPGEKYFILVLKITKYLVQVSKSFVLVLKNNKILATFWLKVSSNICFVLFNIT